MMTFHHPRPLLNCPIENLNCPSHKHQKLVYYCQEEQLMKCELCYTKALANNTISNSYLVRDSSFVKTPLCYNFVVYSLYFR